MYVYIYNLRVVLVVKKLVCISKVRTESRNVPLSPCFYSNCSSSVVKFCYLVRRSTSSNVSEEKRSIVFSQFFCLTDRLKSRNSI